MHGARPERKERMVPMCALISPHVTAVRAEVALEFPEGHLALRALKFWRSVP